MRDICNRRSIGLVSRLTESLLFPLSLFFLFFHLFALSLLTAARSALLLAPSLSPAFWSFATRRGLSQTRERSNETFEPLVYLA